MENLIFFEKIKVKFIVVHVIELGPSNIHIKVFM